MPNPKPKLTAKTADKYALYTKSVQAPEVEAIFLARRYQRMTGRPLRFLREDFCGTAQISAAFVKLHRQNQALGIDLDPEPLQWFEENIAPTLTKSENSRIMLVEKNVLQVRRPSAQLIAALNFSTCVFKTRPQYLEYLRNARRSLEKGGVLILDAYGGSEAHTEYVERTWYRTFKYIWQKEKFDPITHNALCRIHFEFPDGTRLRNAFTYNWRLWTLPEIQELFREAGFQDVHVLWESTDRKRQVGTNVFRRAHKGMADRAWIAYVVGVRP